VTTWASEHKVLRQTDANIVGQLARLADLQHAPSVSNQTKRRNLRQKESAFERLHENVCRILGTGCLLYLECPILDMALNEVVVNIYVFGPRVL
jgi:hypothetical protein